MPVRGTGIQYGTENQRHQGLKSPQSGTYVINPKKKHYDCLKIDEFWTYAGKKKNKVWLIYAYHRESGEIAAYVWGKRGIKTAKKLRERIKGLGISYGRISTDNWDSFLAVFGEDTHSAGKTHTVGIKRNNCRLRHRIRRAFRRSSCFSKKLCNQRLTWPSFTSTMALFKGYHTLWITT
jgi:IS1 family transposase